MSYYVITGYYMLPRWPFVEIMPCGFTTFTGPLLSTGFVSEITCRM